jgi:proteasome assembly chaperone (PAC2) family protein
MMPPLHLCPNGLGELADLRDAAGRSVAHCVEPEDARQLLNHVNGRAGLLAELAEAREELEEMRRFLRRFRNSGEWHAERKRRMRKADQEGRD